MTFRSPTVQQLQALAEGCGLSIAAHDLPFFQNMLAASAASYALLDSVPDEVPAVRHARTPGHRPDGAEDPLNIWYRKTRVAGAPHGLLQGRRVALKDNVMLAGVPMMNGTTVLDGFVPDFDATVVTRLLDAGAEIVGKAHCESLCLSAGSSTNSTGPTRNPHDPARSTGGSSSGCAAAVASGEADMAVGGDQGGSIRMPASFCGIVGLKPTHGLVPYTGIMPIEITVDHAGPMTRNVADNALMLEVLAGDDGLDPRQRAITTHRYTEALGQPVQGMRVGLVAEGFGRPGAEPQVEAAVRASAERLRALGVEVHEISIPVHTQAGALTRPIYAEGTTRTLFQGDGYGGGRNDVYGVALMDRFRHWRRQADTLSDTAKVVMLTAAHAQATHGSRYYAKAMNVARRIRRAYDAQLEHFDLLMMPTTPMRAIALPQPGEPRESQLLRAAAVLGNTMQFDVTHHPAISLPCAMADGLPVGLMLVGRHFDEPTIYRLAHAFELAYDWRRL